MTLISTMPATRPIAWGFATDIDWIPTVLLAAVCATVVFAAGIGVAMKFAPAQRMPISPAAHMITPMPATSPGPDPAALRALAEQRDALVGGCVKVRGLLDDQLLTDVLDDALRRGGVTVFDATGAAMDRSRHRIDHTVPAPDPSAEGIVARTLAPGYLDNGRVLRPADVVVYQWDRS